MSLANVNSIDFNEQIHSQYIINAVIFLKIVSRSEIEKKNLNTK